MRLRQKGAAFCDRGTPLRRRLFPLALPAPKGFLSGARVAHRNGAVRSLGTSGKNRDIEQCLCLSIEVVTEGVEMLRSPTQNVIRFQVKLDGVQLVGPHCEQ